MIDPSWYDLENVWVRAGAFFVGFFVLALLVGLLWRSTIWRLVHKGHSGLDDVIFSSLRSLVVWALINAGAYTASKELAVSTEDSTLWHYVTNVLSVVWVVLAVVATLRIMNAVARWRLGQLEESPGDHRDLLTRATFFGKLASAILIFIGLLFSLSIMGVDTSPLIAGGAIGGIVIGIALQDTLSNVFAGFFLNIDQPIKIGDYIKIEGSEEGFVEEVGWRYTRVKLWSNNLLIVPNGKLSQSTIVNYNLPAEPLSIYVYCGVSYDSDLDKVEAVAIRVATVVQERNEGGDTEWEPIVRFKEFGDSSINFVVTLRSTEVRSQYRIHHEFIKELHKTFKSEGIEIPYPVRTVLMKDPRQENPSGLNERADSHTS